MSSVADLAMIPARVLADLGLHSYGVTTAHVRDRLAHLGAQDPELAATIADQLARCALRLIAHGHPRPAALADDALAVIDPGGWTA